MENYLDNLNPQQRAAVEYTDGPQLVIAGAGSGKTRVLTYKIVHLIENGFEPWRILALTFTNKAAREMRERIEPLVGEKTARQLWMGTFHSIFLRILRQNAQLIGFNSNFTIYDASDSKALVKTIIKNMGLDDKIYKPNNIAAQISELKNKLISPARYAMASDAIEADRRANRSMFYRIYQIYVERCFAASAMDFDDLLYYTNMLLRDNPDVLHHYQEFFRYVLVDEYQDTNFAQHMIVNQICAQSHALCVVGDDAQSIYSFRGANISNILNMERSYPELRTFKLEQNYRSTQNIINAANSLIRANKQQIPKNVFSTNSVGKRIDIEQCYSDFEEGYLVANRISQLKMKTHDSYDEFAILYRTNAQSRVLEESLRKRNIPYRIYGGLSFYQRKEVKDALAYFRLTVNTSDDVSLKRIINFPKRGIGDKTVEKLELAAAQNTCSIWEVIENRDLMASLFTAGIRKKLNDFYDLIYGFNELHASGADAMKVAEKIEVQAKLSAEFGDLTTPENVSKRQNLQELFSGVKQFVENRIEEDNNQVSLADFLGEVSLLTDSDSTDNEEKVTLMTAHAAKGLEFNNVFIVGVEDDLFPSEMAKRGNSQSAIEEERRLLYVAITRARQFCTLSYAKSRYRGGKTTAPMPSPFLNDLDKRYINWPGHSDRGPRSVPSTSYSTPFYATATGTPTPSAQRDASRWLPQEDTPNSTPSASSASAGACGIHTANELSVGMIIDHSRFGRGKIIEIDASRADAPRIVVEFANTDNRTLLLKFARFTIIS